MELDYAHSFVCDFMRTFADESGVLQRHFIAQNTTVFYSRHHLLIDTVCACEITVAFVRVALTFFRTVFFLRGLTYMVHFKKKKHDNMFWTSLLGHGKRKRWPKNTDPQCSVKDCLEEINLTFRNDGEHPLCENHKRADGVICADGTEICYCFYCNKAHSVDEFTEKTNVCDHHYFRRKRRLLEK
jgi:hypothetical protein